MYVFSQEEREEYILINYLFRDNVKISEMEADLKVSRTTIKKDIKDFKSSRTRDMNQLENDIFLNNYPNKRGGKKKWGIDMCRQMPYYHLYDEYIQSKIKSRKKEIIL